MRRPRAFDAVDRRALGAALLSCCAIALFAVEGLLPGPSGFPGLEDGPKWHESVGRRVDSLFAVYGIARSHVKTWQVGVPNHPAVRTEQRVRVPPSFASVRFNHDLSKAIRPFGARVAATERIREEVVTMHIVRSGRTVRSMVFMTNPRLRPTE